jgi:hypothetical protein
MVSKSIGIYTSFTLGVIFLTTTNIFSQSEKVSIKLSCIHKCATNKGMNIKVKFCNLLDTSILLNIKLAGNYNVQINENLHSKGGELFFAVYDSSNKLLPLDISDLIAVSGGKTKIYNPKFKYIKNGQCFNFHTTIPINMIKLKKEEYKLKIFYNLDGASYIESNFINFRII